MGRHARTLCSTPHLSSVTGWTCSCSRPYLGDRDTCQIHFPSAHTKGTQQSHALDLPGGRLSLCWIYSVTRKRVENGTKKIEASRASMSKEGKKEAVFLTTKVRAKLKGDGSWLQRSTDAETETEKEKPWLAEARARRVNGATVETSPGSSSPTASTPSPTKTDAERAPSSGFIIRGVFTKLDKPASSSTTNGVSQTSTQFTKKPSESSYKKLAPYTTKPTPENQEDQLSTEEQEKRTEAASNVLKKSAGRQRSYVLSAAKKYESQENASSVNTSPAFVARRVEISDDDESAATPAPAPSPAVPVTSDASEPEPQKTASTTVETAANETAANEPAANEPVAPKVEEEAASEDEDEDDPPPVLSVTVKDPFEGMKPGCTKVDTPLPVLLPEYVQAVCTEPEPEPEDTPPVDLAPVSTSPIPPAPTSPLPPKPLPKPRSNVDTLAALSDTLISFDTSSTSFNDDEPALAEEEGSSADSRAAEDGVEQEPEPELSNCIPMTADLLALTDGPDESAEPVPPSPGRWSQDLLSGLDSESNPVQTSGALDLLADDVIPINTEARSITETVTITTETVIITDKSQEDNADPWSSTVTVTESSSADPFDPYPIGTTSSNSSSDLLQPLSDISIKSVSSTYMENKEPSPETNMSSNALESLADNVIPISTDTTSLSSHRSWARTWETSPPQESQEAAPGGQTEEQTLVRFERKSSEDDSPWDRWTSPTVYTVTTEEEEDEEESPEYTQTETVTTITTIREMHSDPEPAMDRYETYSRAETVEVKTPEPEAKKGFVYVKEYVNATELSLHNVRDEPNGMSDYLTSSSTGYSYSSPSTYSSGPLSSSCNFCGQLVGNDAKITIEHLNINCHPTCFQCGVCSKPMGDLLDSMFLHGGKVHCETCYSKALD